VGGEPAAAQGLGVRDDLLDQPDAVATAGAIANAVWHATGIRVREFPITLDRLLDPA